MECKIEKKEQHSIVTLAGEVDLHCSAEARKSILSQISEMKHVMVDLSQVKYIDSSAIASLVEGIQMAKHANLKFSLISVSNEAMQVLKLARLDKVFSIFSNEDEALTG